jgi:hypothetical protein
VQVPQFVLKIAVTERTLKLFLLQLNAMMMVQLTMMDVRQVVKLKLAGDVQAVPAQLVTTAMKFAETVITLILQEPGK